MRNGWLSITSGWRTHGRVVWAVAVLVGCGWLWPATAGAELLTADRAVELALQNNVDVIGANAGVIEAKGGVYGAASGILPQFTASWSRTGSFTDNQPTSGFRVVGGQLIQATGVNDIESYSTSPVISGTWPVLNLSSLTSFFAARTGLGAARHRRTAARNDVALITRRQFYEVVKAIHLAEVATGALRLARDDERRVEALYEVGSVSKSDLLKAQVATAQSELDSLTANQQVTVQRIVLANQIGVQERQMGDVDTVLTIEPRTYDEAALLAEAEHNRPDLKAAEAELRAAKRSHAAARLARLPYVTVSGSVAFNPKFHQKTSTDTLGGGPPLVSSFISEDDREWRGTVALNWNVFDGLATDSRIAAARGQLIRAREARDLLRRDLEHEVHQAVLDYSAAIERRRVARHAIESATENLNLTQQKYNVGSATILELIDAQVQLQRTRSDHVSALAAVRVAESEIDRVRGRTE